MRAMHSTRNKQEMPPHANEHKLRVSILYTIFIGENDFLLRFSVLELGLIETFDSFQNGLLSFFRCHL